MTLESLCGIRKLLRVCIMITCTVKTTQTQKDSQTLCHPFGNTHASITAYLCTNPSQVSVQQQILPIISWNCVGQEILGRQQAH